MQADGTGVLKLKKINPFSPHLTSSSGAISSQADGHRAEWRTGPVKTRHLKEEVSNGKELFELLLQQGTRSLLGTPSGLQ